MKEEGGLLNCSCCRRQASNSSWSAVLVTISSQVSSKHVAAEANLNSIKKFQENGRQHHLDHRHSRRDHLMCDHRVLDSMLHPWQTLSKYRQVRWKMHSDNGCRYSHGSRTCQRIVQTRSLKSYHGLSRRGSGTGKQDKMTRKVTHYSKSLIFCL